MPTINNYKYENGQFTPPDFFLTDVNDRLSIVGNGLGLTTIKLNLTAKTDQDRNILFLTLKDCKVIGNIKLADCAYLTFENCWFEDSSIELAGVWDSRITNCHFVRSSVLINGRPGKCPNLAGGFESNCITISGCRFEGSGSSNKPLLEALSSRKLFIHNNKFHGNLPKPLEVPHLRMSAVHDCIITNNNFAMGRGSYIFLNNCQRMKFDNIYDGRNRFTIMNSTDIITV